MAKSKVLPDGSPKTDTPLPPMPDLSEAIAATNEAEAEAFVTKLVDAMDAQATSQQIPASRKQLDEAARFNICYYAAIYHHTDLARVQRLYGAKHPVYQVDDEEVSLVTSTPTAVETTPREGPPPAATANVSEPTATN